MAHLCLLFKALPLHRRVVQLRVGIAQLPLVDKQLKTLRHARQGAMPAWTRQSRLRSKMRVQSSEGPDCVSSVLFH